MAEFQVRSDAVDVEQIMRQIRARIREKRGADYTEQEIRELASVKLEKFLDPRGVRSNLVEDFRRNRVVSPEPKTVGIGDIDVYGSPRAALRAIRRFLNPILRLFFSPTPLVHSVNSLTKDQNAVNAEFHRRFRQREEMDPLYYEVIHNLVVELTRLSIENSNLKMRVESLSSRMDFDERRARALESVVQYKPAPRPGHIERPQGERVQNERPQGERVQNERPQSERPQAERVQSERPQGDKTQGERPASDRPQGDRAQADPQRAGLEPRDQGERGERRRRRRRRRRPGQNAAGGGVQGSESNVQGQSGVQGSASGFQGSESDGDYDGPDDGGSDDTGGDDRGAEPVAQSTSPTTQSNSPISDDRSSSPVTNSPDSQISSDGPKE
jgi:hypothetical protein